ncbi:hypothetical protein BACEGG_01758 [Bacteroides eggerthii DSM 20697]|nr:hypothetical protein BACEGG_01758 [Bacteroides eggerthii DSM 20697]
MKAKKKSVRFRTLCTFSDKSLTFFVYMDTGFPNTTERTSQYD